MMATQRSGRWISCPAGLWALALAAIFVLQIAGATLAQAQSSVRPPEGATESTTGGNVPGGALGNTSDSEMWRSIRKGIEGTVSIPDKNAAILVQSEGDNWRAIKNGPIVQWGAWAMLGMVVLLGLFYLLRGRVRLEGGYSGKTVVRFAEIERIAHWLLAVSFIILAITGLNITYGKLFLMPVIGKPAFAAITSAGKWLHNYVAFAFMVGLVMIVVLWIKDNFPNRYDLLWIAKGGGMFTKGSHPPAKKFNAGQKIVFWLVILGGISISMSGIALMFPFQTSMFGKTFAFLNLFGFDFATDLAPIYEQQLATAWHAIMALFLVVVILAHIYIGTLGMEGAFDAMGSGEVDVNWAKEHHSIWAKEVVGASSKSKARSGKAGGKARAAPAE